MVWYSAVSLWCGTVRYGDGTVQPGMVTVQNGMAWPYDMLHTGMPLWAAYRGACEAG